LLLRRQPARLGKWLRQLLGEIDRGELAPLPMRVFAADEIVAALRWMQQGKHIGKVVVSMRDKPQTIAAGDSDELAPLEMRADGTYLITGGLGGFGLELARRLVARGARSLVLMGRSGKPTSAAQTVLEEMRATGANVRIVAADVTQSNDVRAVLDD